MKIPLPKLKALLLYFSNNTDTIFLGKVKLMKLFYFLDFMHVKEYGTPVTYDTYIKLEYGPIPSTIKNLIDTATEEIDISELADTIHFEKPTGTQMIRVLPNRPFLQSDEGYFSDTELDMLKKVCMRFGNKNTKFIVDASHNEAPWKATTFLDEIPYTLAAKDLDSKATEEDIALLSQLAS